MKVILFTSQQSIRWAPAGEVGACCDDDTVLLVLDQLREGTGTEDHTQCTAVVTGIFNCQPTLQPLNGDCVVEYRELSAAVGGRLWVEGTHMKMVLRTPTCMYIQYLK